MILERNEIEKTILSYLSFNDLGKRILEAYPDIEHAFNGDNKSIFELIKSDIDDGCTPPIAQLCAVRPEVAKDFANGYWYTELLWEYYCGKLMEMHVADKRRAVIENIHRKEKRGDDITDELRELERLKIKAGSGWVSGREAAVQMMQTIDKKEVSYETKIGFVDNHARICKNDFVIVGGRPSAGKTSLTSQMMIAFAREGHRCAYFSLDTSIDRFARRLAGTLAMINSLKIRDNTMTDQEMQRFIEATEELGNLPIELYGDASTELDDLTSQIAQLKSKHNDLKFVFIDHITKVRANSKDVRTMVMKITDELQQWCRRYDITVIAISQLNRSSDQENRQIKMSDFRESGSIEEDASLMFGLWVDNDGVREKEEAFTRAKGGGQLVDVQYGVNIQCLKQKDGYTGADRIQFCASNYLFMDFSSC